ncbi:MAG: hypothetical protein P1P84_05695 [Deferrisomatales bacterium]|nr:hypothetical protein [Deferrisomatales bacterium]
MNCDAIERLKAYLGGMEPGPIREEQELTALLSDAWPQLANSSDGGMKPDKLFGRMEDLCWAPLTSALSFRIERHGGLVNGSTRAEIQSWNVNLAARSAECRETGHRQFLPMSKRFDAKALAVDVASLVERRLEAPGLKWHPDGRVKILIGELVPEGNAQRTMTGRRKRFRVALESILVPKGWQLIRHNEFAPPGAADTQRS